MQRMAPNVSFVQFPIFFHLQDYNRFLLCFGTVVIIALIFDQSPLFSAVNI